MIDGFHILARGDTGVGDLIIWGIVIAMAVIGWLSKKYKEKYGSQKEERAYEEEARRQQGQTPYQQPQRPAPQAEFEVEEEAKDWNVWEQAQQPPPVPPPVLRPAPQPPVIRRPARKVEAERPGEEGPSTRSVEEEILRQQERLREELAAAEQRLNALAPAAAPPAPAEAPLAETTGEERKIRVLVNLRGQRELLRAFVYSEIFGPPKSLRQELESWER